MSQVSMNKKQHIVLIKRCWTFWVCCVFRNPSGRDQDRTILLNTIYELHNNVTQSGPWEDNQGGQSGRTIRNQGGKSGRIIRDNNQDNQEPEKRIRNWGSIRQATHEGKARYLKGEIFFKIKEEVTRQNHTLIHMQTQMRQEKIN